MNLRALAASATVVVLGAASVAWTAPAAIGAAPGPSISLTRTASPASGAQLGTPITYTFHVVNDGSVPLTGVGVVVTPIRFPLNLYTGPTCPGTVLAAGASMDCAATDYPSFYDVDAGVITDSATVSGTPPTGPAVTASSSMSVSVIADAAIFVDAQVANPNPAPGVGTVITYGYLIANGPNAILHNVQFVDSRVPPAGPLVPANNFGCSFRLMGPRERDQCQESYTVTQADVDHGSVVDTATFTGTTLGGVTASVQAMTNVVSITQTPTLTLTKTASPTLVTTVGQAVTYTFHLTNTGNVTLHGFTVSDTQAAPAGPLSSGPTCPASTLAPGAATDCTATYKVTPADLNAATIKDTATASALDPQGGAVVTDPSSATVTAHAVASPPSPSTSAPTPTTSPSTTGGELASTGFPTGSALSIAGALLIAGLVLLGATTRRGRE